MTTSCIDNEKTHSVHDCNHCSVRSHCLAAGVDGEHFDEFEASRFDLRVLRKGHHLFRAGEPFGALFIVRSGAVKTAVVSQDGEEQVTGFYLPGEIFGLDGIDSGEYSSNAIALETCSVCLYSFDKLISLAQKSARLQRQLWQQASREIGTRQKMLMTMGHRSAEARMAEFLLGLASRFKAIGYSATNFHLPMSRQDIADYLGMSVETVCRVLTRFQKQGRIQRAQREIKLVNVEALLALSMSASDLPDPLPLGTRQTASSQRSNSYAAVGR
ncbi:MAG: helix-turn-helix domain-containing protein [Pseudomonadales bacterium]